MSGSVVILGAFGNSLLAPTIESLNENGIQTRAVIIDGKVDDRSRRIEINRLDRSFAILDPTDMHLPTIPFYFISNHNAVECESLIRSLKADYLISTGTPRILKKNIIECTNGVINCHPGILPKYRGCTAVEWSIYNNDNVGATAHFMDYNIDTGAIILSKSLEIRSYESYEIIRTKMLFHQAAMLGESARICIEKKLDSSILPEQGEGQYYKPIPNKLLIEVKEKLARGEYRSACH